MKIGFSLPQFGGQAHQASLIPRFARELEEAGAHSLWVGDRLLAAVNPTIGYGGTDSVPEIFDFPLDPFVVLTLAAATTERVRLGSNVLNAPFYQPALLARLLSSIDVASRGRLTAGFGIGWSPEEYQALGVPFNHRGARLDETLDALENIWTSDRPKYSGKYVTVPEFRNGLHSTQQPHIPIYLAGFAEPALRRIARRAAGWLPVLSVGRMGPEFIAKTRASLDRIAEEAGRDPSTIDVVLRVNAAVQIPLPELAGAVLNAAEKTGIEEFFFDLTYQTDTVEGVLAQAHELLELVNAS